MRIAPADETCRIYFFANATSPGYAGTNYGSNIVIQQQYDVDDGSNEANYLPATIAHEVAHYYWSGNSDWIDEGMANLLETKAEHARTGKQIAATTQPCSAFDNIAQLDRAKLSLETPDYTCNYALGERLFIELLDALGSSAFSNALQNLYLESTVEDSNPTAGTKVGIKEIRRLFGKTAGGATVIRRWYDGNRTLRHQPHRPVATDVEVAHHPGRDHKSSIGTPTERYRNDTVLDENALRSCLPTAQIQTQRRGRPLRKASDPGPVLPRWPHD